MLDIAILSCNYGGGHQRVAEVLADTLRSHVPGCRVEIHDYIERFIGHLPNVIFTSCYFGSVRWAPRLYRWFYYGTGAIPLDSPWQRLINNLGKARLASYLRARRPDVIICTYCLPAGAISALKQQGLVQTPCVTVITDHAIHSQWLHPAIDLYLVSCEQIRRGVIARGLPADRVLATGIPVAQSQACSGHPQALRQRYGLDPALPTILVMVGAYNLMRGALEVYRAIVGIQRPLQLLVVCGKDASLRARIEALSWHAQIPVRVFGYVRHIPELMAMSDLIVSKAGGVTTSEALAAELPMVVINPIPGQEEENARFMQSVGTALVAQSPAALRPLVTALLDSPEHLAHMRAGARRIKRPDAAADAVAAILSHAGIATS